MAPNKLSILIVGGGGREHALAWTLSQSPQAGAIFIAPGNAGTSLCGTNVPIRDDDVEGLVDFATANAIDLTVVGPELPLAAGIVDQFAAKGLRIFGPSQAAAQLETSKDFAKAFMRRMGIPTAESGTFNEYDAALEAVRAAPWPVVIKASGLAAGKGVVVCKDVAEAEAALHRMMVERVFGSAGNTVLVEERLSGPELSLLAVTDGQTIVPLLAARDHKRVFEQDQGPNTGGMGAYAPPPDARPGLIDGIRRTVLEPAVVGMAEMGTPYVGVLYAGLMLTESGPKVLEFNCRFGDPETQAILPLLESDLMELMLACTSGDLHPALVRFQPGASTTVVMAAHGYPGSYPRGVPITGLEAAAGTGALVFHAGTAREAGRVVTAGGRVLAVTGRGVDVASAAAKAYEGIAKIKFDGAHFRRDIGRPVADEGQP